MTLFDLEVHYKTGVVRFKPLRLGAWNLTESWISPRPSSREMMSPNVLRNNSYGARLFKGAVET